MSEFIIRNGHVFDPVQGIKGDKKDIAVKDGKIVEQGQHKELLQQKGYYHMLYSRQFAEESAMRVLH